MLQLWGMPLLAELDRARGPGHDELYGIFVLHKSLGNAGKRNSRELNGNLNKTP